jgi:MFS family permease
VAGQLASNIGDAFYAVALPWYVLAGHGGAVLLAEVLAAYGIPRTALVAVGGHASDRWHPWTVMLCADAVRALAVGALAVAAGWQGQPDGAVLLPIAVVLGAGEGLFLPGSFSIIPTLLPDADLQAANALASSGTQLATLVGPAIGGGLVAAVGPSVAFAFDAASFLLSTATLAGIRAARSMSRFGLLPSAISVSERPGEAELAADRPPTPAARTIRQVLRSERVLQIILVVTLAGNLGFGGMSEVALPSLAHGPFHTGAAGYGTLIAAFGAGALAGTLIAGRTLRIRRPAIVGSVAFLIEAIFTLLIPYLGGPWPAGGALFVAGLLNGFANVLTITAFQRWAPPDSLGRLMGLLLLCSFGIFPVSVAVAGVIVHRYGPDPFFPATAAVLAVAVLAGLTQRAWRNFGAAPQRTEVAPHQYACDGNRHRVP